MSKIYRRCTEDEVYNKVLHFYKNQFRYLLKHELDKIKRTADEEKRLTRIAKTKQLLEKMKENLTKLQQPDFREGMMKELRVLYSENSLSENAILID